MRSPGLPPDRKWLQRDCILGEFRYFYISNQTENMWVQQEEEEEEGHAAYEETGIVSFHKMLLVLHI